jgi:hypothetical protein
MNAVEAAQKNGKAENCTNNFLDLANAQNKSKNAGTFIPPLSCGSLFRSMASPVIALAIPIRTAHRGESMILWLFYS